MLQYALRSLLLEGIYDVVAHERGFQMPVITQPYHTPSHAAGLVYFLESEERAAMTPLCRWKNSEWENLLPTADEGP